MPAYLIATVKVTDDAWIPEYAAKVHDIAAKHGGKYLSRSANLTQLEGEAPNADVVALIEFPSVDAAQAFAGRSRLCAFRRGPSGRDNQLSFRD